MEAKKKYALVTGGTMGIGYELVRLLAEDGYNIVIVARTQADLNRVAAEISESYGIEVITLAKDLFDVENAFSTYEEVKLQNITIDILVNNAGQGQYGKFVDTDIRRELDIIHLNVSSLVVLTKLFLQDMVARNNGMILNLSSIASKVPGPWQSVYHGTKAFVQSFTEAIRSEVKDSGVTITSLLPGATDTDFFNKANMNESKVVQSGKLAPADKVAEDGYQALKSGDDKVVSGLMNKIQVAMSNITPDSSAADKMKRQQEPAEPK